MSTQREVDEFGEIFHLFIKVRWVMAYQYFKASIVKIFLLELK
jgi:hypothetical protein